MPQGKNESWTRPAGAALASAGLLSAGWLLDAMRRERKRRRLHRRLIDLLLNALSAGDPDTARHSRRVADLSYALARDAGVRGRELHTLRVAALLHDMGKIDDQFFEIVHSRKPLSDAERARIRHHPHESAHILAPLEPMHPGIRRIVSSHHECWDGSGYPHRLAGAEIPLGARVIAIADAFDAMTQPRTYSSALPVPQALARLQEGAGTQFDPGLVTRVCRPELAGRWAEVVRRGLSGDNLAGGEKGGNAERSGSRP